MEQGLHFQPTNKYIKFGSDHTIRDQETSCQRNRLVYIVRTHGRKFHCVTTNKKFDNLPITYFRHCDYF